VNIFLNKRGLLEALGRAGHSAAQHNLEDFLLGFSQASELFWIADVGYGKEAVDGKIKGKTLGPFRLGKSLLLK
jgi:hypothetical protein